MEATWWPWSQANTLRKISKVVQSIKEARSRQSRGLNFWERRDKWSRSSFGGPELSFYFLTLCSVSTALGRDRDSLGSRGTYIFCWIASLSKANGIREASYGHLLDWRWLNHWKAICVSRLLARSLPLIPQRLPSQLFIISESTFTLKDLGGTCRNMARGLLIGTLGLRESNEDAQPLLSSTEL